MVKQTATENTGVKNPTVNESEIGRAKAPRTTCPERGYIPNLLATLNRNVAATDPRKSNNATPGPP
jgi:hypothetical protein